MVVAQLAEQSLPTPGVRGSNPVIGKIYIELFTANCIEKTKIKKKRPGMVHLKTFLVAIVYACSIGLPGFDMDSRLTEHPRRIGCKEFCLQFLFILLY